MKNKNNFQKPEWLKQLESEVELTFQNWDRRFSIIRHARIVGSHLANANMNFVDEVRRFERDFQDDAAQMEIKIDRCLGAGYIK